MVNRVPRPDCEPGEQQQMRLPPAPAPRNPEADSGANDPTPWPPGSQALARLNRQLGWIVAFSCFPKSQGECGELPRERYSRELLAHSAREHSLIQILQWTRPRRGGGRSSFQHILEQPTVIAIEPARHRRAPPPHWPTALHRVL